MRVGIVIPAFNVAAYLGTAIESVIAQSSSDWAAVVVDDGSQDATGAVAAGYADSRISLIRQANAGVSAARNAGLTRLGPVDAVLFLDADDWLAPDALARLCAALSPPAVGACGPYIQVADDGRPRGSARRPGRRGDMLPGLLERNLFANGGHVLLRAAAVARAGGFRTDISYGEDWEFMVRIALQGRFDTAQGAPLLFVRQRPGGATLGMAFDPAAHARCTEAIFANPALAARYGTRLAVLRRHSDAERDWIVGRELIRHGSRAAGLRALRRSVQVRPSLKRAALYAAAQALPVMPQRLHGPFRAYPADPDYLLKPSTG